MIESVNVDRLRLIEKLNEKLEKNRAEREERRVEADEKLDDLLADLSSFERRYLVDVIRNQRACGRWDADPNDREATDWRSAPDENPAATRVNPDEEYERLVRALEISPDETVALDPDTDVYRML